jgi:hypothetical protein
VIYLLVFFKLIRQLSASFPMFYRLHRQRLFTLSFIILLTILFRVAISIMFSMSHVYKLVIESARSNSWLYVLFISCTLSGNLILPITAMLYSLNHSIN